MTPAESALVTAFLAAAFPNTRWSDATRDLYEAMLADLDNDVVRHAIARLIATKTFLPTIAEIREAAANVVLGPCRSGVEAWGDVKLAIRRVGHYDTPTFDDPLVADCVRIMGWRDLCIADTPEAADRARFCELYADLQRKQRQHDVSEPGRLLPGAQASKQLPANVRQLTEGLGVPAAVQPNHGMTGFEKARRL